MSVDRTPILVIDDIAGTVVEGWLAMLQSYQSIL